MSITYNWTILSMESYPILEDYTNVVFKVYWAIEAVDDMIRSPVNFGTHDINYKADSTFIPYSELTKEIVLGWLFDAMGDEKTTIEENMRKSLPAVSAPAVQTLTNPWEPATSPLISPQAFNVNDLPMPPVVTDEVYVFPPVS